jgi:hypothetical protein
VVIILLQIFASALIYRVYYNKYRFAEASGMHADGRDGRSGGGKAGPSSVGRRSRIRQAARHPAAIGRENAACRIDRKDRG